MSCTAFNLFDLTSIYPTGVLNAEPIWKLRVGSQLVTGESTCSYENNTQTLTLDLSFKIPMSVLQEAAKPRTPTGATNTTSSGATAHEFQESGLNN